MSTNSAITVTPGYFQINVKPGDSIQLKSVLSNNTDQDVTFKVSFTNISIYDLLKRDTSAFTDSEEVIYPSNWITSDDGEVTISANSYKELSYTMNVPAFAKFENYYPVILFKQVTGEQDSKLGINADIATVVYMNMASVEGAETSSGELKIEKFQVKNPVVIFPSANIDIGIKNDSSNYLYPVGDIIIYDNNQQRQDDILRVNNDYKPLLPGDTYSENIQWNPGIEFSLIPKFGTYKLVAEVKDDLNHRLISKETTFFVLPIFHIAILVIIILGLFAFFFSKKKSFLSHNKHKK